MRTTLLERQTKQLTQTIVIDNSQKSFDDYVAKMFGKVKISKQSQKVPDIILYICLCLGMKMQKISKHKKN